MGNPSPSLLVLQQIARVLGLVTCVAVITCVLGPYTVRVLQCAQCHAGAITLRAHRDIECVSGAGCWCRRQMLNDMERHQIAREIWLHIQLNHPSIIALYAAWKDRDYIYLVLEWAPEVGICCAGMTRLVHTAVVCTTRYLRCSVGQQHAFQPTHAHDQHRWGGVLQCCAPQTWHSAAELRFLCMCVCCPAGQCVHLPAAERWPAA
jgi:hypothetical protein